MSSRTTGATPPGTAPSNPASPAGPRSGLDRFFGISALGSSVGQEVRGGIATFLAMSYIVVLNPLILSGPDSTGAVLGIPRVAAATALVAAVATLAMGLWARHPFALASGLGVNAFLAITVATTPGLTWPDVMGLVVIAGLVMVVLVATGFRTAVFNAVPEALKTAIVVGIGLFIALIGLVNAGFVRRLPDAAGTTVPVGLGTGGELAGWPVLVFIVGLLVTAILVIRNVRGAILVGIVTATVLANILEAVFHIGPSVGADGSHNPTGWALVAPSLPEWAAPDLSLLGSARPFGAFEAVGGLMGALLVFAILLSVFFDAMGSTVGLAREAGSMDEHGNVPRLNRVLMVDALAVTGGGAASASAGQIYVESGTGIGEGARTGLASVVTGLMFVATIFLTPLIHLVPFEAVAPALVVVGFMMCSQVVRIDWTDWGAALPAFLTFILMPFTYSIANGIGAGMIAYAVIRTGQGRAREVHPLLWVVAAAFVLYFGMGVFRGILGLA
ncbi:NCS2 family permease [Micrococcus porci]|uniref:NCS2 family permease n=1 Tax=Micrococcus porci TaxID=2856555 RepID=UPI001CCF461E|nr:NCS2 family permease [Micrococcus porci]UBH25565.1 NCS2 family permease [Micrococcus porci]